MPTRGLFEVALIGGRVAEARLNVIIPKILLSHLASLADKMPA
jgi:hypothetical protein